MVDGADPVSASELALVNRRANDVNANDTLEDDLCVEEEDEEGMFEGRLNRRWMNSERA